MSWRSKYLVDETAGPGCAREAFGMIELAQYDYVKCKKEVEGRWEENQFPSQCLEWMTMEPFCSSTDCPFEEPAAASQPTT